MSITRKKPYNLLYSFSILSFICIILISAASAFVLTHFLTDNMLERDAQVTMQFVQRMAGLNNAASYFEIHSRQLQVADPDSFGASELQGDVQVALENFFMNVATMPEVVRGNVYAKDGTVIWSSQQDLIGQRFDDNEELREALSGEVIVETGTADDHEKEEHVEFPEEVSDFVENYIPIWDTNKATVVGVVEVYRVPVALFDSIAAGSRLVWSSALLGGLFLYGALFWIVRRAGFLIRRQHEQLVESESLAAVGEMASAITHSIRNSLASIRSSAEVLLEGGDIRHSDEAAQDIVGESDSVEAGIRELLAYSQPLSYSPEPLQGNEVIRHSLQHFERVIAKHHIVVDLDLEESTLLFQGDVGLLGQVFEGLIANALDAMSSGGTLTIKNHLTADGKNARIKIADTGQGVPSDQVDKVFQPFYTTKSNGLGIGLSLIQRIVKQHGGTIELTSRQGQGTEVCVQLPVLN